jgi:hypothetical protein
VPCFYLQEDRALDYIAGFGINPDEVRSLPNGPFIARDPRSWRALSGKVFQ